MPSMPVAVIVGALIVAATTAVVRARSAIRDDDDKGRLLAWLGVGSALGVGGAGVLAWDLARTDFTPQDHAYGSIFYTLAGFATVVIAMALVMAAQTIVYSAKGHYNSHRFSPVDNITRFWIAAAVIWVISLGVLYGTPYLT